MVVDLEIVEVELSEYEAETPLSIYINLAVNQFRTCSHFTCPSLVCISQICLERD